MKGKIFAAIAVLAAASSAAYGSTASEALGECIYKNSSADQKNQLIQWAYVSIGKTSAAKSVQAIPEAKSKEVTSKVKSTLSDLVLRSCPKESAALLLSDPQNGAADAMEHLTVLMIRDKVRSQIGDVLSLQSSGSSGTAGLIKGLGSLLKK